MKTIYRYEINNEINKVKMPFGAKILCVDISHADAIGHKIPSIWVEVDSNNNCEERTFVVVGTGADIDFLDNYEHKYIGTCIEKNRYAFHVYEVIYKEV